MKILSITNSLFLLHLFLVPLSYAEDRITYTKDIAPIFQEHCLECHRPGQMGPFVMTDYRSVRPWAKSIRKEVYDRRMPPWHADPSIKTKFANDRSMTQEEIDTILDWVDQGAPKGNPNDLATPVEWVDDWNIGEPDVVLKMPAAVTISAEGEGIYTVYHSKTDFAEDRWIQAAEARAGNPRVVHHLFVNYIDPLDKQVQSKSKRVSGYVVGTAPGKSPSVYPPGVGSKLPKNSTLHWELHYEPTGQPETDQSYIGLIFTKEPPEREAVFRQVDLQDFTIPAGHSNYQVESTYKFDVPVYLYSLYPHMHLRGKSFSFEAEWPDGRKEMLLNVPQYDFNWQTIYNLDDPIPLPAGSEIHCVAHFDNSAENPANPNPNIDVPWGPNTEDEMMIGVFMTIEPRGRSHQQTSSNQDPLKRNIGGLVTLAVMVCITFLIPILRK